MTPARTVGSAPGIVEARGLQQPEQLRRQRGQTDQRAADNSGAKCVDAGLCLGVERAVDGADDGCVAMGIFHDVLLSYVLLSK
jgi:hypothetical protein